MSLLVPFDIGLLMGLLMVWAVLALALGFRLLDFPDLTVEGSLPLGAAVFATFYKNGSPMIVAIGAAILTGGCAGALTAFLHVHFRLNKFLAGIIVVAISYSCSLRIMGSSNIGILQLRSLFDLVEGGNALIPGIHFGTILLLIAILFLVGGGILFGLTSRFGLNMRVAGSNPDYARTLGINVPVNLVLGLAMTNALAAMSGVLLAMHQGFVDVGMGQGVLILALAAMTLGERLFPEKWLPFHAYVFSSAILGSILYQVLVAYAVRAGLNPTDLKLATALAVLGVVALKMTKGGDLFEERTL